MGVRKAVSRLNCVIPEHTHRSSQVLKETKRMIDVEIRVTGTIECKRASFRRNHRYH